MPYLELYLCENAHHHADYSSAQWAVTTLVRYATCTVLAESCVSAGHQGKAFAKHTSQHHDGVSAAAGIPGTDAAAVCSCCSLSFLSPSFSSPSFSSLSFSSPANSTPATLSVIFQSCKFQSLFLQAKCNFRQKSAILRF